MHRVTHRRSQEWAEFFFLRDTDFILPRRKFHFIGIKKILLRDKNILPFPQIICRTPSKNPFLTLTEAMQNLLIEDIKHTPISFRQQVNIKTFRNTFLCRTRVLKNHSLENIEHFLHDTDFILPRRKFHFIGMKKNILRDKIKLPCPQMSAG